MTLTVRGATIAGSDRPTTIAVGERVITAIGDEAVAGNTFEAAGLVAAPGLIDLQINGAYGEDFTSDPSSIWRVGERLPEHGVTAFLPTIISAPPEVIEHALAVLGKRPVSYQGAEPLGLHAEGPMLSPQRAGIHDPAHLRPPTHKLVRDWTRERGVAMVTLAPELSGAQSVVRTLVSAGVVVSAGHSAADYEEATAGFQGGISSVTHLFNAMSPLHHRDPGLIGASLDTADVTVTLIVDGVHLHPSVVRAVWKVMGPGRIALVTDAISAAGMGPGTYEIGATTVEVADGRCLDRQGRLAGSTLTMDRAVRNMMHFSGCSAADALAMASSVPARLLGLDKRGRLTEGASGDLALFDEEMRVVATVIAGELVFRR